MPTSSLVDGRRTVWCPREFPAYDDEPEGANVGLVSGHEVQGPLVAAIPVGVCVWASAASLMLERFLFCVSC